MKTKLSILRALQTLSKINFDELFRRVRDRLNAKHKSGPRWTLIVFTLLCSAALAIPATFDIGWDLNPPADGVVGYNIYLGPTNTPLVRLGSVGATNKANLTLPDGAYQIRVSAANMIEEGQPSLPLYVIVTGSNVVAITKGPGAPLNVQLR